MYTTCIKAQRNCATEKRRVEAKTRPSTVGECVRLHYGGDYCFGHFIAKNR